MIKRKDENIKKFAESSGTLVYGFATVSDDWINQVKTYRKVEITQQTLSMMYIATMAMFVELFIARIEDLTTPKERAMLEREVIERIIYFFEIVNFAEQPNAKEKAKDIESLIMELISSHRENEIKHNFTIPQAYIASFATSFNEVPRRAFGTVYRNEGKLT